MTEPKYGDGLTDRQREIFDYIESYQREKGKVPTIRHMASVFGVSKRTIQGHLDRMGDKGIVCRSAESKSFQLKAEYSKGAYVKVVGA